MGNATALARTSTHARSIRSMSRSGCGAMPSPASRILYYSQARTCEKSAAAFASGKGPSSTMRLKSSPPPRSSITMYVSLGVVTTWGG